MEDRVPIFDLLPTSAQEWLDSLPWDKRRYLLSLCYVICATPLESQACFLDEYTADGLITRLLKDIDAQQRVKSHLQRFRINVSLTEEVLRQYIRQFYIHSAQETHQQLDLYLEAILKLVNDGHKLSNIFHYILGFELLTLMFQMSWSQHEQLYSLQRRQEEFISNYIRPIQHAHRINGIIIPKHEGQFFARREYYVQRPKLSGKRLQTLVMATFKVLTVCELGASVIRHPKSFEFDYDYLFENRENEVFFSEISGSLCR